MQSHALHTLIWDHYVARIWLIYVCAWYTLCRRVVIMGILSFVYMYLRVTLIAWAALSLHNKNNNGSKFWYKISHFWRKIQIHYINPVFKMSSPDWWWVNLKQICWNFYYSIKLTLAFDWYFISSTPKGWTAKLLLARFQYKEVERIFLTGTSNTCYFIRSTPTSLLIIS